MSQIARMAGSSANRLTMAYTWRPHHGRSAVRSAATSVSQLVTAAPDTEVEGCEPHEEPEDEEARVVEHVDRSGWNR